jgi:uncharacterized membrane protein (UPF0127 family)
MSRRALLAGVALALAVIALSPAAPGLAQDACRRWRDAFTSMPVQMITIEVGSRKVALRVKSAESGEQQAAGFQCSTPQEIEHNLILFDFGREIHTQFHMQNVPAALDIAFVKADGAIFSILKMDPSPTALYGPMGNFRFALEARAGFYESQGVRQGEARLVVQAAK